MDVQIRTLAPMQVAFLRHVGPNEDEALRRTWDRLLFWADQRAMLSPRTKLLGIDHDNPHVTPPDEAPGFQLYRNTPRETAPEDLVTDIYVPLRPR